MARLQPLTILRRMAVLGAVLALAGCAASGPALWKASGPGAKVDMFGSIHLLSDATRWRNPAFDAELAKADQLWFEIPLGPGSQSEVVKLVQAQGLLPPGQSLTSLLPPALAARVKALAAKEGMAPALLERMKPWFAELELTLLYYQRLGYREDLGVEQQVDAAAPPTAKREAFETVGEQIALFADASIPDQIASLKETMDELDTDPGLFDRMAAAWKRGDARELTSEVVDKMRKEDPQLYTRILVARNRRFAARIEEMLRHGSGRVFVVVGAGHLLGPDGVPALLRRDGFKVSGP